MLTVFYDMDEVLNLFVKKAIGIYNQEYQDNLDYKMDKYFFWEADVKADKKYFMDLFSRPGIYLDAEPRPDAVEWMGKLVAEGYDVRILTYPQWIGPCPTEKVIWLQRHFPFLDLDKALFMGRDKYFLAGPDRILLDDNPGCLTSWHEHRGISVVFNRLCNAGLDLPRVNNHEEFYHLVKEIERGLKV